MPSFLKVLGGSLVVAWSIIGLAWAAWWTSEEAGLIVASAVLASGAALLVAVMAWLLTRKLKALGD